MHYKLIGTNNTSNIISTVLKNRGIEDWKGYLNLSHASRNTYADLYHINDAVELFDKHFQKKNKMKILMDNDVDGVCSAAIIYRFIKSLDSEYPVSIAIHTNNKSHGLDSYDFCVEDDVKLLVIPDAGSSNLTQHIEFSKKNIACLCLDHHHVSIDIDTSPAVIINNQTSPLYQNKNCCGASITLEFCRALEEYYWEDVCDKYLDLVAIANICDVMPISEFETKAIINEGLSQINNKMLQEIIKAQDYSMKGKINPHTIGFYVGPLINSFIRLATFEERQLLLRAFCEDESETFEYTKRGESFPTEENIYEHCVRLMKSYKGKQDRKRDKAVNLLLDNIAEYTDDKVIIIDATKEIDGPLTGLVAIKISEAINKPVLLVRKTGNNILAGSGRAFNNCPIENFRGLVEENPYIDWGQGHNAAFGCQLQEDNIEQATNWFNEQLKDVNMDKIYQVDFIFNADDISIGFIQEIVSYQDLWGHGLEEPLVAIENISVVRNDIYIQGKNLDSVAFSINDIKFVQFKLKNGDPLYDFMNVWDGSPDDAIALNVIGGCNINEYQGILEPQIIIKDCEVIK